MRAIALAAALAGWAVVSAVAQPAKVPVPPTGVLACVGFEKDGMPTAQACADADSLALVPKQDGLQGAGRPAYEAVAGQPRTACVRDRVSGLVWEGKPDSGKQPWPVLYDGPERTPRFDIDAYGPQNEPVPGSRGHSEAYSLGSKGRPGDATAYVAQVNTSRLCGFTDWRLPTAAELYGLIDLGKERLSDVSPKLPLAEQAVVDAQWFPNTVPGIYMTSEWRDETSVWCVSFANGFLYNCEPDMKRKPLPLFVRLVRGAEAPSVGRWRELPNERRVPGGAVEDRHTGLVWRRCEEPQTWNGTRCIWSAKRYDSVRALQHAAKEEGWRLPSIKELNSLAQREADRFELPPAGFPGPAEDGPQVGHWSSTMCVARPATSTERAVVAGWVLSDDGNIICESRTRHFRLRLVRE